MPPPNPIRAIGVILEQKAPRLYQASLPNGKEVVAHVPHWNRALEGVVFPPGAKVKLELTAYDFSTARIAGPAEEEEA